MQLWSFRLQRACENTQTLDQGEHSCGCVLVICAEMGGEPWFNKSHDR